MTAAELILAARKTARLGLRETARRLKRPDGGSYSPGYLCDLEAGRTAIDNDHLIAELARVLPVCADRLHYLAGSLPPRLRGRESSDEEVCRAFAAMDAVLIPHPRALLPRE